MAVTFRALNTESFQSGSAHRLALPGAVVGDFVVVIAGTRATGCVMSVDGFGTYHLNGPDAAPTTAVFAGTWQGDTTIRFAQDTAKSWVAYAFDPYTIDMSSPLIVREHRRPDSQLNVALPDIDAWGWPAEDDWWYATQGVAIGASFYNGGASKQNGTAPSELPAYGVNRYGPDNTWLTMHAGGWGAYPSRPVSFPVFSLSAARRSASVAVVIQPKTPPYVDDFWWGASGLGLQFDLATRENADRWAWDFGDGDSSSDRAPWHQFRNITPSLTALAAAQVGSTSQVNVSGGASEYPGAYLVTATAGNGYGERSRQEWVGDFPRPQLLEYVWSWGDGSPDDATLTPYATHHYFPGTYTVTLTARNSRGTSAPATVQVVVKPEPPVAAFRWSRQPGLVVELQDESQRATSRTWYLVSPAGAETAIGTDPVMTYLFTDPGTYRVRLRVANVSGSSSTDRVIALDADWTAVELPNGLTTVVQLGSSEVTCEVQDMTWAWGARGDEGLVTSPDATRLTIRLHDPDGELDPDNPQGAYATQAYVGNDVIVRVGTPLAMGLAWRGWVEALRHDGITATLDVTDSIGRLASLRWETGGPVSRPAEGVSDRIIGLLSHVGWPTALQDITTDTTPLQAVTFQGSSAWTQVANAALGCGVLDVTAAGLVRYRPRAAAMTPPASEAVISCMPGDVAPVSVTREQALAAMANDLTAGNSELGSHRWYSQASKDKHGHASATFTYPWATAAARDSFAAAVLSHNSTPPVTLRCVVRPTPDTILPLLGLRFRDTVDVVVNPYDTQAWVLGGRWYLDPRKVELELVTSQVRPLQAWAAWQDGGAVGWVPDQGVGGAPLPSVGIQVHRSEHIPGYGPGGDTVPFSSTLKATGGMTYSISAREVVVPVAGWYKLVGTAGISIETGGYRNVRFLVNGVASKGQGTETPNSSSYGRIIQATDLVWLEAGGRVAMYVEAIGTVISQMGPCTLSVAL